MFSKNVQVKSQVEVKEDYSAYEVQKLCHVYSETCTRTSNERFLSVSVTPDFTKASRTEMPKTVTSV